MGNISKRFKMQIYETTQAVQMEYELTLNVIITDTRKLLSVISNDGLDYFATVSLNSMKNHDNCLRDMRK